ncbi:MAG: flagellar biosynthetic protein FliO [Deltaproteobacteria bacterium]|nr:flagellar biosynthetic protein FliO [Deltaproteobacteria bacterium]MBW1736388.1 flagellar biosynthetic protein FliO [Deltaproteobacteria bacterium]MBW1908127.1 flagellar biosynthetic protein FliO [Deltaproteobacteria bacterium]MBW2032206.1 flagellar biosynthetic protein FliO [Deltaproteobacteria bacterium]MBW2113779.1 flagellar biosynthetic protein FliO [Deltaproteobacteria bacterium]
MNYHPDLISTALKMLAALAVILGGLLFVFYFSKRIFKRDVGGSKEKLIRVLANSYIGVKKNISLVEVAGIVLVLGVTNDNISLLTKIEKKEILDKFKRLEGEKTSPSFSDQLHELSSRFRRHRNEG